jgi:NitT/TauT family transport system ATP-binding protein
MTDTLITARGLTKTFATLDGELPVLDAIDLDVRDGEILALLGKSGSGKSTLLRCLAGLIAPTAGTVAHRGRRVQGTNPGTSMVFQSFALLPWLTVQQNVEVGLEAQGVASAERARRADEAIDLIGLDGFGAAYPKELSGGMRQRVGFARALVTHPDVLLMDEPFSALDVLTAENLRNELIELWARADFPINAIVIVTHNIEEAVLLADRVVVLGANPGRIRAEYQVVLDRPRKRGTPDVDVLIDAVYAVMMGRAAVDEAPPDPTEERHTPGTVPLPHATVDALSGLAEILHQTSTPNDLGDLSADLGLEVDDLIPQADALELLHFAEIAGGTIELTDDGRGFAAADIHTSKAIFAAAAQRFPLIRVIVRALQRSADGGLRRGFFVEILRRHFSDKEAAVQLDVAIDWGRYAELFDLDTTRDELHLDPALRAAHQRETVAAHH